MNDWSEFTQHHPISPSPTDEEKKRWDELVRQMRSLDEISGAESVMSSFYHNVILRGHGFDSKEPLIMSRPKRLLLINLEEAKKDGRNKPSIIHWIDMSIPKDILIGGPYWSDVEIIQNPLGCTSRIDIVITSSQIHIRGVHEPFGISTTITDTNKPIPPNIFATIAMQIMARRCPETYPPPPKVDEKIFHIEK